MLASLLLLVGQVFLEKSVATRLRAGLALATFLFIVLDVVYYISSGSVLNFAGHDPGEVLLHVSSYYGIAFVLMGSFGLKRRS